MEMTAKDSHFISSSGAFKPHLSHFIAVCSYFGFHIYHHRPVHHLIQYFFKSSILIQIALYLSSSFSSTLEKNINLLSSSLSLSLI